MNALLALILAGLFTTPFTGPEKPLSEGGAWHHSAAQWHAVNKQNGRAQASAANENYDDSYALLSGYPADITVQGRIYRAPAADCTVSREVELLLRMADTATTVRGYEVLFSCAMRIAMVVRWDGCMGCFVVIGSSYGEADPQDGDTVKATISGSHITAYLQHGQEPPRLVAEATDSKWTTGNPGVGFFVRPGGSGSLGDLALTSYSVKAP